MSVDAESLKMGVGVSMAPVRPRMARMISRWGIACAVPVEAVKTSES